MLVEDVQDNRVYDAREGIKHGRRDSDCKGRCCNLGQRSGKGQDGKQGHHQSSPSQSARYTMVSSP